VRRNGELVLRYDQLVAEDATGRKLEARMVAEGERVWIEVDDATAIYPLNIDPTLSQQAYLKASNTDRIDDFGSAVAISGDTIVIGAKFEDSNSTGVNGDQSNNLASGAGAAYVFVRNGVTWSQQAYLKASNTDAFDEFGVSVAISGDTVIVGALGESSNATGVNGDENNLGNGSGAAYVFVRSGTTWSQQAYLKASNTGDGDGFGFAVAISGETVVVSAANEDSNATGVNGDQNNDSAVTSGAAYVFVRSGTTWSQQAYLKASNTNGGDFFGNSVAISGDTVVVGAPDEDSHATGVNGDQSDNSAASSGAAYVYVRTGATWSQEAYLKASNTEANDDFGFSVSISGEIIVVGAPGEDSNAIGVNGDQANNAASNAGAAYVFVRTGTTWSQEAYLKASNTDALDGFGVSVAIFGNVVVVGASAEDSSATGVNGNQSDNSFLASGAAYVFVRNATSWSQQAYLKASNTDPQDIFGTAVAISGNTIVVGAEGEDSNATGVNGDQSDDSVLSAGAAYVFLITCGIACPGDQSINLGPGDSQCCAVADYVTPTADPACGPVHCAPASGTCFPRGITTVTCATTDGPACSFRIIVVDNTPPAITCPANIIKSADANQCGAVAAYNTTASDNCSGVTTICAPTSGSFFPKGTTSVTCTATDGSGNTATCSFTVTVNDTQPPSIACPAGITVVAAQTCPPSTSVVVNYPSPAVSDNCPGVMAVCSPPSGSSFAVGTTTVACTATDSSGNTASCSFSVTAFGGCLQDDSNPGAVVLFNPQTGDYRFCCNGRVLTGRGTLSVRGCVIQIEQTAADRRVLIKIDESTKSGMAALQTPTGTTTCSIIDRDIRNNGCQCVTGS
jgi:HYR domain-containing protein/FG-GAP repeat protein